MKRIFYLLIQGLLLIAPVGITIYVVYTIVMLLSAFFNAVGINFNPWLDPIIGILGSIAILVFIGYLSSTLMFRPIFSAIENFFTNMPLVKIIFSAIKDLFSAFVSDKKKFEQPVLIDISQDGTLQKMGFITTKDLTHLGIHERVAVYMPHSYAFSGNMFLVKKDRITILKNVSSAEAMKFIVSGGVTSLIEKENQNE